MRPILFSISLPNAALPLWLAGATVGLAALCYAVFSFRTASKRRAVGALGVAVVAAVAAFRSWGLYWEPNRLEVTSFGGLLTTALMGGYFVVRAFCRLEGVPQRLVLGLYVPSCIGGFLAARVHYVLDNLSSLQAPWQALSFQRGGLSAFGALLGGSFTLAFLLRRRERLRAVVFDAAGLAFVFGASVTRLGCYLYGCDFGAPLSSTAPGWLRALGIFPRWEESGWASGSPAWLAHVSERGLPTSVPLSLPVHPTQLYEAVALLLLLGAMLLRARWRPPRGELFVWALIGYAGLRFAIDMYRDDPERLLLGPNLSPTMGMAIGLWLLLVGALVGPYRRSLLRRHIGVKRRRLAMAGVLSAVTLTCVVVGRALSGTVSVALSSSQWLALFTGLSSYWLWARLVRDRATEKETVTDAVRSDRGPGGVVA